MTTIADEYRANLKLAIDYHRTLVNEDRTAHHRLYSRIIRDGDLSRLVNGYSTLLAVIIENVVTAATNAGTTTTPNDVFTALADYAVAALAGDQLDVEIEFVHMIEQLNQEGDNE